MVDVTAKMATHRSATACGTVHTTAEVVAMVASGGLPKGDALATARVAGILAAKRTSDLIPMCHQLALNGVDVDFRIGAADVGITASVRTTTAFARLSAVPAGTPSPAAPPSASGSATSTGASA